MIRSTDLLDAAQAAARLGVKPATLYAYVSRGILPRYRSEDGRRSLFDPSDLARLGRRSGARRGSPTEVVVASSLTLKDPSTGRLWYRGLDVAEACMSRRFEEVAGWLWTGRFEDTPAFRPAARSLRTARRAQATLGRSAPGARRVQVIATAVATEHARQRPPSEIGAAADLMGCLVEALPGGNAAPDDSLAARLWTKLTDHPGEDPRLRLLDACLSAGADGDAGQPTLVARISAAGGESVADAVCAALAAGAERLVTSSLGDLEAAIATAAEDGALRAVDVMPHDAVASASSSYPTGDPRAQALLRLLESTRPGVAAATRALSDELRRRSGGGGASLPLAQAAVCHAGGMRPGSSEVITLISRVAGWIAHALEEHRQPTPYRSRLAYTGPPPRSAPRKMLDAVQDYLARE